MKYKKVLSFHNKPTLFFIYYFFFFTVIFFIFTKIKIYTSIICQFIMNYLHYDLIFII